jgi:hypothetical protein
MSFKHQIVTIYWENYMQVRIPVPINFTNPQVPLEVAAVDPNMLDTLTGHCEMILLRLRQYRPKT